MTAQTMARAVMRFLIAGSTACACASGGNSGAPIPPAMSDAVLTVEVVSGDLVLPARPDGAEVIEWSAVALENPQAQGFSLRASVRAGGESSEVGSVAPYPADKPSRFQLRLPAAALALLERAAASGERGVLHVMLEPVASDRPLRAPLRVSLGELAWQ